MLHGQTLPWFRGAEPRARDCRPDSDVGLSQPGGRGPASRWSVPGSLLTLVLSGHLWLVDTSPQDLCHPLHLAPSPWACVPLCGVTSLIELGATLLPCDHLLINHTAVTLFPYQVTSEVLGVRT